jgi:hypothetical protein
MQKEIKPLFDKVWTESTYDFEDRERKFPEQYVVAVEYSNDGGTETIAFCQTDWVADLIADIYKTRIN